MPLQSNTTRQDDSTDWEQTVQAQYRLSVNRALVNTTTKDRLQPVNNTTS